MEKYQGLRDITNKYLKASLSDLNIHYNGDDNVIIHIEYKDNVYTYDYDLEVDKKSHQTEFINHDCYVHGLHTKLNRNVEFELAIENYLFNHKA